MVIWIQLKEIPIMCIKSCISKVAEYIWKLLQEYVVSEKKQKVLTSTEYLVKQNKEITQNKVPNDTLK